MANKKDKERLKNLYLVIGALAALIAVLAVVIALDGGIFEQKKKTPVLNEGTKDTSSPTVTADNFLDVIDKSGAETVKLVMSDDREVTIELYPKVAPVTVANFLSLVDEGFYDGLTFHRVIAGFMAQGGAFDPDNQANDPAKNIKGEFSDNGFENKLSHQRGVISMARATDFDSASSQFFICYDDASILDGQYASFGYVTAGMDVVDSFLEVGTDEGDRPLSEIKIKTIARIK